MRVVVGGVSAYEYTAGAGVTTGALPVDLAGGICFATTMSPIRRATDTATSVNPIHKPACPYPSAWVSRFACPARTITSQTIDQPIATTDNQRRRSHQATAKGVIRAIIEPWRRRGQC